RLRTAPAPGDVDVVGERDRERRRAAVADVVAEGPQEGVDRRPLRVGQRGGRGEAAVLVAGAAALLVAGQVPERARDQVAGAVAEIEHAVIAQGRRERLARREALPGPLRDVE